MFLNSLKFYLLPSACPCFDGWSSTFQWMTSIISLLFFLVHPLVTWTHPRDRACESPFLVFFFLGETSANRGKVSTGTFCQPTKSTFGFGNWILRRSWYPKRAKASSKIITCLYIYIQLDDVRWCIENVSSCAIVSWDPFVYLSFDFPPSFGVVPAIDFALRHLGDGFKAPGGWYTRVWNR